MAGRIFNQSAGIARWNGRDGAAVLRLAGRLGIWDNRNVEPVRYWIGVTEITGNLPAAAAAAFGRGLQQQLGPTCGPSAGHRRLSNEMFGHGGNYSTVFLNDPLTGTIVVRQGENNATGRVVPHPERLSAGMDGDGARLHGRHELEQQLRGARDLTRVGDRARE